MNYDLSNTSSRGGKRSTFKALSKLLELIREERKVLWLALFAILLNAGVNLAGPLLIGHAIDRFVIPGNYHGVIVYSTILLVLYLFGLLASYQQTMLMGGVGQRMLFTLRNAVFSKLQELPVAFFNQNKAGDLISRVNNDTDKINTFFSQSLMQFVGNLSLIAGSAIFLLLINWRLGLAALSPALLAWVFTRLLSGWVKRKNAASLKSLGSMSAEVQESLNNFKVIVAFNRRDFFRIKFAAANRENYRQAIYAGIVNNIFLPVYSLMSGAAQLIVLVYGIVLIAGGFFAPGLLIAYLAYANSFYAPLRQLATLWSNFQAALAGWDRISDILGLENSLTVLPATGARDGAFLVEFQQVHFGYADGPEILHDVSLRLERGKTYAFVGPTGGGKSTTASLIARLYDPVSGRILWNGRDLRTLTPAERSRQIAFILQEPFLFSGTVGENIAYGNVAGGEFREEDLNTRIKEAGLGKLLGLFDGGLAAEVNSSGENISLGQKQLIAFMRAVLRNPDLLILDEATANIDTVTEHLLSETLDQLPASTTKVIIAHRLNTIQNADEIFFVNSGQVLPAGSLEHAIEMLQKGRRAS